jgi:hypothetical protein
MSGEALLRRIAVPSIFLAVLLAASVSAASPKPEIVGIGGQIRGREARVKFTLQNAFTPEMVEALKSGIEISFKTAVRVERVHHGWFNTTLGERKFSRSVKYDVLARVYRLSREGGEDILPDIHAALAGMTRYEVVVPMFMEVEPGKTYRAYVRTRLDRVGLSEPLRSIIFFSSIWDVETEWARGYLTAP